MGRLRFRLRGLLVLMALVCVVLGVITWKKYRDTLSARHFPLAVGHKWVYAFGDSEVIFEVLRTEKLGDATLYVVQRTIDQEKVEFKVSVDKDGVYIHQDGDKVFNPPQRQFAFWTRTGATWEWKGSAGGKPEVLHFAHGGLQSVDVPAGTFSAICIDQQNAASIDRATFWLAKDIGVVKVSGKTEIQPGKGLVIFEWTLKKFEPGK